VFELQQMFCDDDDDNVTYWERSRPTQGRAFPARSLDTWKHKQGSRGCDSTASWGSRSYWRQRSSYRTDSVSRICCSQPTCLSAWHKNIPTVTYRHPEDELWYLSVKVDAFATSPTCWPSPL